MLKGCVAGVAVGFGVRIHVVVALPSVMFVLFEVAVEGWLIARRERRVVPCEEVCVVVHGCAWETRCLQARISTTGHCIICHHTKPHDRVRSKQHTSTRYAKACHSTAWLHNSAHARCCRDSSMAEQGRYAPKESATPTLFRRCADCGLRKCAIVRQSVGSVSGLPSSGHERVCKRSWYDRRRRAFDTMRSNMFRGSEPRSAVRSRNDQQSSGRHTRNKEEMLQKKMTEERTTDICSVRLSSRAA